MARSLNVTALGDDLAKSMGGNVARTQALSLVAVTLLAGAATAGAGPIGFVGLMVPHAVRRFTGPDWRWILGLRVRLAPALLLAADIVGRVIIRPAELPAGIVTAFLGAPVLIWLIRKRGSGPHVTIRSVAVFGRRQCVVRLGRMSTPRVLARDHRGASLLAAAACHRQSSQSVSASTPWHPATCSAC